MIFYHNNFRVNDIDWRFSGSDLMQLPPAFLPTVSLHIQNIDHIVDDMSVGRWFVLIRVLEEVFPRVSRID
jgi:hypothetical protein